MMTYYGECDMVNVLGSRRNKEFLRGLSYYQLINVGSIL
jgi:hypothetical protein